jgi:hypothetical protein
MIGLYFILLLLALVVVITFTFFRHKIVPEPEIHVEKEVLRIPKRKYFIKVGSCCKVKYNYYLPSNFNDVQTKELYTNIIVSNIWIEEPFHTIFTSILKFLEDNDDCINSESTRKIKIKIAKTNESANAYKVYSIKELIFMTVDKVYRQIRTEYNSKDIQIILLATLLFKINLLRSMSSVYNDINDINCTDIFLDKFENSKKVIGVIKQIRQETEQFNFVNIIFQNSKKFAIEFPYEDSHKSQKNLLALSKYVPNIKKKLISSNKFSVS